MAGENALGSSTRAAPGRRGRPRLAARLAATLLTSSAAACAGSTALQQPAAAEPARADGGTRATLHPACAALATAGLPNLVIERAQWVAAGPSGDDPERMMTGASGAGAMLPAHCLVRGEIDGRTGADGRHYGIRFEVRMPEGWQHRLMFQGGGGLDGFLANALGTVPTLGSTARPALARGYAVVSMDGGHPTKDPGFAFDQQARLDYAYAAIGRVTQQAKRLVTQYYAAAPRHSYFMGCSNGGREAMLAAQRYPMEFDGVVAGNAGFRLSRAAVAQAWDTQAFMSVAPRDGSGRAVLSRAFTDADLKLVADAVLSACDALDGIEDGLINDHLACRFDPAVLRCSPGRRSRCLSAKHVAALRRVFDGPTDGRGSALYSSWPYDAGVADPGWRVWKLGFSQESAAPDSLGATLGAGSLGTYFMTPPAQRFDQLAFDFDRDVPRVAQVGALNDATSTYLTTFEARGGKLLLFHGLSDPVFSAHDIMRWFDAVERDTDAGVAERTLGWARLFMVPGMTHCGGGPALDDFDPLAAIERWVEEGRAPEFLPARGKAFPGREQPLCPYPQIARYVGGEPERVTSYRCVPGAR
jgi:feruloyl esterase